MQAVDDDMQCLPGELNDHVGGPVLANNHTNTTETFSSGVSERIVGGKNHSFFVIGLFHGRAITDVSMRLDPGTRRSSVLIHFPSNTGRTLPSAPLCSNPKPACAILYLFPLSHSSEGKEKKEIGVLACRSLAIHVMSYLSQHPFTFCGGWIVKREIWRWTLCSCVKEESTK